MEDLDDPGEALGKNGSICSQMKDVREKNSMTETRRNVKAGRKRKEINNIVEERKKSMEERRSYNETLPFIFEISQML